MIKLLLLRNVNILHIKAGLLQGFSIKYMSMLFLIFGKYIRFDIPYWINGYDKDYAKKIEAIERVLGKLEDRK